MADDLYISVKGLDEVKRELGHVSSNVVKAADKLIKEQAREVAQKATEAATVSPKFPSNLNRSKNGLTGEIIFNVRKRGPLSVRVEDGGGLGGKAAAIAEYAAKGISPQGKHLIEVLHDRFPAELNPGRNAWDIYRKQFDDMQQAVALAVDMCLADLKRVAE